MDHAIDAGLNLYKSAKIRHASHNCTHYRASRILLRSHRPRIRLSLLQPQRNLLFFPVHVQYDNLYLVPEIYHLARMRKTTRPAHLADVNQPLDSVFQTDKNTVIHNIDYFTLHARL